LKLEIKSVVFLLPNAWNYPSANTHSTAVGASLLLAKVIGLASTNGDK
jgi:hypothetical protein